MYICPIYTPEAYEDNPQPSVEPPPKPPVPQAGTKHYSNVHHDPANLLPRGIRVKFTSLLDEYDHVFDSNIKGYNGSEGPF